MRFFALILVVFIGFEGGVLAGESLSSRTDMLEKTARLLREIQNRLLFRHEIYAELLNGIPEVREVLDDTLFISSPAFLEQLEQAVENGRCAKWLEEKQRALLREALCQMGGSTRAAEGERMEYYACFFEEEARTAKKQEQEKKTLYRSIGLYCGVLAAILLA